MANNSSTNKDEKKNVCVVVLGDIGRSPRMQFHSLSLAEQGHKVDIIGYGETDPMDEIKSHPSVYYHYMMPCPAIPIKLVNYAFKTVFQALNLLFLLVIARRPEVLIVQNPPAIPALIVCWIFCRILRCKFIIDWHNYGHTIMALNLHTKHTLVQITEKVETFIGQRADHNFCVTNAMKKDLEKSKNINASTLYDKPAERYRPISLQEKHAILLDLGKSYPELLSDKNSTRWTECIDNKVELKKNRPGLVVSSTSWTEDEDFSVLFTALQEFENHHVEGNVRKLPDLVCLITGKGHLKEYYCNKIAEQKWKHVTVLTPWLQSEDYPKILASADLGVCLHTSSSGLDLPMKVVDMFGCCLPVCAFDYNCLHELVENGKNSYTFKDSEELSRQLLSWFDNFPDNLEQKIIEQKFKSELETFQKLRWRENWISSAYSHFK